MEFLMKMQESNLEDEPELEKVKEPITIELQKVSEAELKALIPQLS